MKSKSHFLLFIPIIYIGINGCDFSTKKTQPVTVESKEYFTTIADTLISDVVIKNPDKDEWTDYCLRNLDKKTLVDEIFKAIYDGKLTPYEFFNDEVLSIDDIKSLEKDSEFSRDKIAKVQFEEAWHYDSENQKMTKKVHSIMMAYEIYNSEGKIKGYKPAFKVYFK